MNRIKDKLAESVRQARGTATASAPASQAASAVAKADAKAARKTAPRAAAQRPPAMPTGPRGDDAARTGGEPQASARALFPDRVWPD